MPPVIPIVIGAVATAAGVSALVVSIITIAASILVSLIFKPKYNMGDMGTAINMSRDPSAPREYVYGETRLGGTIEYVESTGDDNDILWLVVSYADHEIDSYTGYYIDNVEVAIDGSGNVTTSPYNGAVSFYGHTGLAGQTVDTTLDAASTNWTSAHRLRGTAYGVWRLAYARDIFPTGLPNLSVKLKGKPVYDPRLDSTVSGGSGSHREDDDTTWAWSENVVLASLDYLRDDYIGPDYPMSAFEASNLIAQANVCDESVALKAGGSIARYGVNGPVNGDMTGEAVLDFMMPAMAGTFTYSGGIFRFHAGQYDTPNTDVITDDQIVEIVSWSPTPGAANVVNQVKGRFINTAADFQPEDYPARLDATAKAQDGGQDQIRDLDLPFENDHRRGQRIAEIALRSERQRGQGKIRCTMAALNVKVWDVQKFTIADLGWTNKIFRIVGWQQNPDFTIDLDIKEEASTVYDWTAATDETDFDTPAGAISIVSMEGIDPTGITAIAATFVGSDGSKIPAIKVTWTAPGPFVMYTEVQLSADNGTTWLNYGTVPESSGDGAILTGLVKGTTYKVRIYHVANGNIRSTNADASGSISVTDSTIAGTVLNQGDLAVLDQVDTAEIVDNAVTEVFTYSSAAARDFCTQIVLFNRTGFGTNQLNADFFGGLGSPSANSFGDAVIELEITVDVANVPFLINTDMLLQSTGFAGTKLNVWAKVGVAKSPYTDTVATWLLGADAGTFSDGDGTDPASDGWEWIAHLVENGDGTYVGQLPNSWIWTPTSTGTYKFMMALTTDSGTADHIGDDLTAETRIAHNMTTKNK